MSCRWNLQRQQSLSIPRACCWYSGYKWSASDNKNQTHIHLVWQAEILLLKWGSAETTKVTEVKSPCFHCDCRLRHCSAPSDRSLIMNPKDKSSFRFVKTTHRGSSTALSALQPLTGHLLTAKLHCIFTGKAERGSDFRRTEKWRNTSSELCWLDFNWEALR